jgi:hypothetical protein
MVEEPEYGTREIKYVQRNSQHEGKESRGGIHVDGMGGWLTPESGQRAQSVTGAANRLISGTSSLRGSLRCDALEQAAERIDANGQGRERGSRLCE